jgi:hypothetical protein
MAVVTDNLMLSGEVISNTAVYLAPGFDRGYSNTVSLGLIAGNQLYLPLVFR